MLTLTHMDSCEHRTIKLEAGFTSSPPSFTGRRCWHRHSFNGVSIWGLRQTHFGRAILVFLGSRALVLHVTSAELMSQLHLIMECCRNEVSCLWWPWDQGQSITMPKLQRPIGFLVFNESSYPPRYVKLFKLLKAQPCCRDLRSCPAMIWWYESLPLWMPVHKATSISLAMKG